MRKFFMAALISVSILSIIILPVYADTVNLYGNLDDSNSYCDILTDILQNDPDYDVFDQYVILRAGERDYRVYWAEDLTTSSVIYRYTYIPAYGQVTAQLQRGSTNSLTINSNNYIYVGNTPGAAASLKHSQYKFYFVGIITLILIIVLLLTRHFRRRAGAAPGYTVR